ncbi:MAG: hypothetical protein NT154_22380 [Verrucomicrobia bacterium]|nr:hypothetical protein [Verrucomicrobiota bacterium]
MRRTFSCPSTFFWKFVFTTLLFGGISYWLLMSWLGKITSDDGKRLSLEVLSVLTFTGAAVVAGVIVAAKKLKRVAVEDGYLCVSNYFTEVRIPLSEVVRVREYAGTGAARQYTTFIIDLQYPCVFGELIVFLPKPRLYRSGVHPVVRELQGLCEQARDEKNAVE